MGMPIQLPATEKQLNLLNLLLAETNSDFELPENVGRQTASDMIGTLLDYRREHKGPQWLSVVSSNIRAIALDRHKFYVEFHTGARYEYYPPLEVDVISIYNAWRKAPSKGKFFAAHIRDTYPFRKLESVTEDTGTPPIEDGRYAVNIPAPDGKLRFFRYGPKSQYDKRKVLREVFGSPGSLRSEFVYKAEVAAILAAISLAGETEAMERYGQELGSCGYCGSPLTDATSRRIGIGPVCRKKLDYDDEA